MLACEYVDHINIDNFQQALKSLTKKYKLHNMPSALVLSPHEYMLLLIEKPNVAKNEINAAAKWLVKDLVPYPVDNAAIDTFSMPLATTKKMIYASVIQCDYLKKQVNGVEAAGLRIKKVDVSELALINTFELIKKNTGTHGFLYIDHNILQLMVYNAGEFTLSRKLKLPAETLLTNLQSTQVHNDLTLEIQRSLDYFERQYRQVPPTTLYVTPNLSALHQAYKKNKTGIDVLSIDLKSWIESKQAMSDMQLSHCLMAISAALPREFIDHG